jgi:predicted acyl esterase
MRLMQAQSRVPKISFLWIFICLCTLVSGALSQTRYDLFIHLRTGDSLDASYYLPPQPPPPGGYPGIIFIHGFGLDKFSVMASCSLYSATGYVTLCYSVRGQGNSSGYSSIMSTRERLDFGEVVSWFRDFQGIDTSRIGVTGGSQGGLHGLWAMADRLPVRAVTTDVIIPHWASDIFSNGCVRRTGMLLLQTAGVRYTAARDTLWNYMRLDQYDSLTAAFPRGRDLDTPQLDSSSLPVLQFLKWQDYYFGAEEGINSFNQYTGPKEIYIGTGGHYSDNVQSELVYQYGQITRWFNYYLRGTQNGITGDPVYTYAYSSLPMDTAGSFQWARVGLNSWPESGIQLYPCYLHQDSTLSFVPQSSGDDSLILNNNYLNPSYTFDTAYIEGFRGSRFQAILPKQTLVFTSPPLRTDLMWLGPPRMHLFVRSDDTKFPVHAQVYEVDSSGNRYFINRIDYTARNWVPGTEGIIDAEGIAHAHKFLQGDRIHIELTNIDVTNRVQLGSYPFVVPLIAQAGVTIYMDALRQSSIELPLMGTPLDVAADNSRLPDGLTLFQNYPNPFNPTTTIQFALPKTSFVTLNIYNILGQLVNTLVNERRSSGSYKINFDASHYPSGIYFYKLSAGEFVQVRKMLLIR